MAGIRNDVNERRLIILLCDGSLVHTLGDQVTAIGRTQAQAHSKPHPLAGNGPLQEYRLPVQGTVSGDNHIGQLIGALIALAGIGHPGHLGKNFFSNIRDQRRNSSHLWHLRNTISV